MFLFLAKKPISVYLKSRFSFVFRRGFASGKTAFFIYLCPRCACSSAPEKHYFWRAGAVLGRWDTTYGAAFLSLRKSIVVAHSINRLSRA